MNGAKSKVRLTKDGRDETMLPMNDTRQAWALRGLILAGMASLGGCVSVNAPAEPIVIELNVNIKQEVLYRLVDSANENMEANPEIF